MQRLLLACLFGLVVSLAAAETNSALAPLLQHLEKNPHGEAPASFDVAAYEQDWSRLPIGVFDSGIGGLTVLQALLSLDAFNNQTLQPGPDGVPDFEGERFIYFGDQANMPYGNYPAAGRTDYLRELILKDAVFLLGKRWHDGKRAHLDKPPVKALVIACNTATAYGLDDIRTLLQACKLPIITLGVIEAGARGVREMGKGKSVGVLATLGTCASGAYPTFIGRELSRAGRPVPTVIQQGSAEFAALIEGSSAAPARSLAEQADIEVRALLDQHRANGQGQPLGTIVLGCTHYPLALGEIDAAFARLRGQGRVSVAEELVYVDPAEWTARELFRELAAARLRVKPGDRCVLPRHAFYLSVPQPECPGVVLAADGSLDRTYQYARLPGRLEVEDTINRPLRAEQLPVSSQKLLREKLPLVWQSLNQN